MWWSLTSKHAYFLNNNKNAIISIKKISTDNSRLRINERHSNYYCGINSIVPPRGHNPK